MSVKCPKCNSEHIHTDNKGFGTGKAIGGGALFGPAGMLTGFMGSNKIRFTCLDCGKTWGMKDEMERKRWEKIVEQDNAARGVKPYDAEKSASRQIKLLFILLFLFVIIVGFLSSNK